MDRQQLKVTDAVYSGLNLLDIGAGVLSLREGAIGITQGYRML